MLGQKRNIGAFFLLVGFLTFHANEVATAEDATIWHVSKSSGAVWMTTSGAQQASLTNDALLKPGDTVRTGANGRVLLTRNQETILISPNSVIALPTEPQDGLSTTIIQQAGSILVQAEKRNVKHFQVETPYLAAVVKGTEFRVSLNGRSANVEVLGGQVEVRDFKTGQFVLVLPGQAAKVSATGNGGLSLTGSGKLNTIERGSPRPSPFDRVPVPKGGLAMPSDVPSGKTVLALSQIVDKGSRISAPLGEMTLNFVKATDGLAHGAIMNGSGAKQGISASGDASDGLKANAQDTSTSANGNAGGNGNGIGNGLGLGNGLGNGNAGGNGNGVANGLVNAVSNGVGNSIALGNGNGNGKAKGH